MKITGRVKHALVVENLRALGFVRILAGGVLVDLGEDGAETVEHVGFDLTEAAEALVVVDRLTISSEDRDRLADSLSHVLRRRGGGVHRAHPRFRRWW